MASAAVHIPTGGPPKVVGPKTRTVTRPTSKMPQYLIDEARPPENEKHSFEPKKHLDIQPPKRIYTMKEIGLEGHGISPNALTGAAGKISEVAGVELVPAIEFEIGNINISIDEGPADMSSNNEGIDEMSAFDWHYDSFPFVCVTMLSDCTCMVGGETALKIATGEIMKVRGPAMGTAVVMQGRYIEHRALKARERINMITHFRPKSPFMKDESILTGIRGISPLTEIYNQYTQYRLKNLEEQIRARLKKEQRREIAKRPFDTPDIRALLTEQKEFLEAMLEGLH